MGDSWTDPERFNQVSHIITHAYKFFLVRISTAYISYTWQPLNTGVQWEGCDPLSRSMITLLRMTAWLKGETCEGAQHTQCWHCKLHRWNQRSVSYNQFKARLPSVAVYCGTWYNKHRAAGIVMLLLLFICTSAHPYQHTYPLLLPFAHKGR